MIEAADQNPSGQTVLLIRRHRDGDPEALGQLVERYYPRVLRIVAVRVRSRLRAVTTVEDVVQEVFVRVLEGLDGYEARDDARWIDWVARVAEREIYRTARYHWAERRNPDRLVELVRRAARSATSWSVPADTTGVDAKAESRELEQLVDECLSDLSEPHREVVLLRDYADQSWDAIAEAMARTPAACQELHRRARKELGKHLKRRI